MEHKNNELNERSREVNKIFLLSIILLKGILEIKQAGSGSLRDKEDP